MNNSTPKALHRANIANRQASSAHRAKLARNKNRLIVSQWSKKMSATPLFLVTGLFVVVFVVDFQISWELYRDLVATIYPKHQPFWAVALIGLMIAGFTAVVSHLVSKSIDSRLFGWEVFLAVEVKNDGKTSETLAVEDVENARRRELIQGLLLFILLMASVTAISYQRTILMALGKHDLPGNAGFVQKNLPILLAFLGVFTGIYVHYLVELTRRVILVFHFGRQFEKLTRQTYNSDQIVFELIEDAKSNNEKVPMTKNLLDSIFRFRSRANDDNYVDPNDNDIKEVSISVTNHLGEAVDNVRVAAITAGKTKTPSFFTQDGGHAKIYWQDKSEYLTEVIVGSKSFFGHYLAHQNYDIKIVTTGLQDSAKNLLSSN
nr:hypothetical protein [uncultured Dyadobacter sp.]